jgi:hypothetical protein
LLFIKKLPSEKTVALFIVSLFFYLKKIRKQQQQQQENAASRMWIKLIHRLFFS